MSLLKALVTIDHHGIKKAGELFEEASKKTAKYLVDRKLAVRVEPPTDKSVEDPEDKVEDKPETDAAVTVTDQPADQPKEKVEEPAYDLDAELAKAKTHKELDAIEEQLELKDLPGKDEQKIDERKETIRKAAEVDAE